MYNDVEIISETYEVIAAGNCKFVYFWKTVVLQEKHSNILYYLYCQKLASLTYIHFAAYNMGLYV